MGDTALIQDCCTVIGEWLRCFVRIPEGKFACCIVLLLVAMKCQKIGEWLYWTGVVVLCFALFS